MNKIFKIAAAASLAFGLLAATASSKADSLYGNDIVITPASYSTADESASAYQGIKRGKIVAFNTAKAKGSIIISTKRNELYYVLGSGQAVMYRVATARKGFEWAGTHKVRVRHPELPTFMEGGPKNPLGARAMYLGSSIYRIHGTNEPKSIGKSASSGCIRMLNEDVTELYRLVKIGAEVTVI
jgi:lipoprotein-anchoring transpeptidase ErfK/SrfK